MPHVPFCPRVAAPALAALATLAMAAAQPAKAQISFYTAVDLALRNSHEVKMALADVDRAAAGVAQAKDAYVPMMQIGSGLGYSYGFPVGQPTVVNASANSLALSFSQPAMIRSARASLAAAQASLRDTREKVVAEAALSYIELDSDKQSWRRWTSSTASASGWSRYSASATPPGSRAPWMSLRPSYSMHSSIFAACTSRTIWALLRLRIANLTGLAEDSIASEPSSIPAPPTDPATESLNAKLSTQPRNCLFRGGCPIETVHCV